MNGPGAPRRRAVLWARQAVVAVLAVAVAGVATDVARRAAPAGVALSARAPGTLDDATRRAFADLPEPLFVAAFITDAAAMPSHLRDLPASLAASLAAIHEAAPDGFHWEIADPASNAAAGQLAARRGLAPMRVRHVERDGWSERTVWAGLILQCGARTPVVITGLTMEQVADLPAIILARVRQLREPRRPVIALAVPANTGSPFAATFAELKAALAGMATVRSVNLDGTDAWPDDADAVFWMEPAPTTSARPQELERFLARGRSVVLGGSPLLVTDIAQPTGTRGLAITLARRPDTLSTLLAGQGLVVHDVLVCDTLSETLMFNDVPHRLPAIVRCIGPNQDFHTFAGEPNGGLLFAAASPLALDGPALAARGVVAAVLATTGSDTWLQPATAGVMEAAAMTPERGTRAPKKALLVALTPDSSTRGRLVVAAATTPFQDGLLKRPGYAHEALLRVLVDTLASDERLLVHAIADRQPAALAPAGPASRRWWRVLCLGAVPLALFVAATRRTGWRLRLPASPLRLVRPAALAAGVLTLALSVGWLAALRPVAIDCTADQLHTMAPATQARAAASAAHGPIVADVLFSAADRLPPAVAANRRRALEILGALARAGADLHINEASLDDDASPGTGIAAEPVRTSADGDTTTRRVFAALRLAGNGRTVVIPLSSADAGDTLELRLALALDELSTGRRPVVAVASDEPRLSPAEAYELYQQKGLAAPSGADVYAVARELIARTGFDVRHVDTRAPVIGTGADAPAAIVWFQPRRSASHMIAALALHLHTGGHALLAAQHFSIQSRQYAGTGFKTVYWPQPQSPEVENLWFPELGIHLVRKVFFDELKTRFEQSSQINRKARREFSTMTTALPFVVRAVAANYGDSSITHGVGDLALRFPAFFQLDTARMDALGLKAAVLITSSPRTWSLDWKGGWIPDDVLAGPASRPDVPPVWAGRLALALDITGDFPLPVAALDAPTSLPATVATQPTAPAAPGRLVFVGCSEMFKNDALVDGEFHADQLLVNAVASLALPPDLAALAARRPVARGFEPATPATRLAWRVGTVGGTPAALGLVAVVWHLLRRRRAPASTTHSTTPASAA